MGQDSRDGANRGVYEERREALPPSAHRFSQSSATRSPGSNRGWRKAMALVVYGAQASVD